MNPTMQTNKHHESSPHSFDDPERHTTFSVANQYLTLMLGDEEYGLPILDVQEIRAFSRLTPLPNAPMSVRGVMNLRGRIVPVVDLRCRFGLELVEYTRFTVIVIVRVGAKIVGVAVDAVADVVDIPSAAVQAASDLGSVADASLIRGVARIEERVVVLLRLEAIVAEGASALSSY